ncbi:hypothetical protein [Halapricum hydrolyticum]|uniref:Uncharacterized protein n=1 Tax=Halapricum hydrolyticum TaxID=2979991 RepID=A0AAE3IDL6_9EURY|nr:hypothetical protein [Halapricum hydrolyticum]MCU4718828.1 hypothetical protein [Halapricum hydrolyticum]MCU4727764.1 hypothetical protein [Halapricum hydrolyticum]
MDKLNWGGLFVFSGSVLAGLVLFPLFGPAGFILGLMGALFVGFPLKSVYDERQSRLADLEERVAELETELDQLDSPSNTDD